MEAKRSAKASKRITEARAAAQRAKLDEQAEDRRATPESTKSRKTGGKKAQRNPLARRRASTTIERAIAGLPRRSRGGNSSPKTLQWYAIALGLFRRFLENERGITLIGEVDAPDIGAWFTYLRKTPGNHGKPRAERSIQSYARAARAFFHWLVRHETIERNPFDRVAFLKVGKPLIRTIEPEEFERLLYACTPPGEIGPLADRAASRNRAILWLLYDTGIRLAELCNLRLGDFDRKHGVIIVMGKGSKERRIALGSNCLRNLLYYLNLHRPGEEELAEWGSAGEDHLFLSETRLPLTKNGVSLTTASGNAVIKIAMPSWHSPYGFQQEIATLLRAKIHGYAGVSKFDYERRALLLEQLGPSMQESKLEPKQAIPLLCKTFQQAWLVPPGADHTLHALEYKAQTLAQLIRELWDKLERPCSQNIVSQALEFARRRLDALDPGRCVVVHGDPHPANALLVRAPRAGAESGYVFGDPEGFLTAQRLLDT